jgi:threonyl-tRNA synthetase
MSYQYDHRSLAEEMELYFFDEQVGGGLPVWLPNGMIIREMLEKFIVEKEFRGGYQRVSSPPIGRASLYEKSGHLKFYKNDMYPPLSMKEHGHQQEFYLRPMNCPHHHLVFNVRPRSYRELPFRIAEYGQVFRQEPSGSLHGLRRVRGLCQNDGHIYVDPEKAKEEIKSVLQLHLESYRDLGLSGFHFRLSLHDSSSSDFEGEKEEWLHCEQILRECLIESGLEFFEEVGEAAFYGPKIDIQMHFYSEDKPKIESMSSIQLDFLSAERFNLSFKAENGKLKRPYIIHRAPLGSHERFVAMMLEYYDGQLPYFLCPVQLQIYPLSEEALNFALEIKKNLMKEGIRVHVDEKLGSSLSKRMVLGNKVRPFSMLVLGERELKQNVAQLSLRKQEQQISLKSEDLLKFYLSHYRGYSSGS